MRATEKTSLEIPNRKQNDLRFIFISSSDLPEAKVVYAVSALVNAKMFVSLLLPNRRHRTVRKTVLDGPASLRRK